MFDQLGDGIFRRRYEFLALNVGVIMGEEGVLLVDTRASHREADELVEELRRLTRLPVRWVVNTHWHWDHTFGNAVFEGAEIWGHESCRAALRQHGSAMKDEARKWVAPDRRDEIDDVRIVPPARVFAERASLRIGRRIDLTYHGLAHTDSDVVVRIPGSGVAFFGDIVEQGAPPSFGDSHPLEWPTTLSLATAEETPERVVPGHGDVVGADYVATQHEELVEVAARARRFVDGDAPLDEATAAGPYPVGVMETAMLRARVG